MNFNNFDFKLGYLFGTMDTLTRESSGYIDFKDYVDRINTELDNLKIRSVSDAVFYELIELYSKDIDKQIIDGIEYLLVGEYDDDYDELYGIVFMEFERIKFIDVKDFEKLKSENTCDCCLGSWTDNYNEYGFCNCICSKCREDLRNCKHNCH